MRKNIQDAEPDEDQSSERETPKVKRTPKRKGPRVAIKKEDEEDEEEVNLEEDEEEAEDELPDDDGEEEMDGESEEEESTAGRMYFKVEDRVPPPTSVYRTIQEIHEMLKSGNMNLNPSYQRDSVWKKTRRQALLDSLFNNRPVMSLYFAVTERDGVEYRNVIDGKQRLTTLKLFLSGRVPYKDKRNTSKKEFYWRRHKNVPKTGFLVPREHKAFFEGVKLECVEYHDLPLHQEEAIFKAIQQGMVLVTGEKNRVGDDSARRKFIRELAEERLKKPTKSHTTLKMDVERGRDFTNLASFIYCATHLPHERAHPTNEKLNTWLDDPTSFTEQFQGRINSALDDFWEMVDDHSEPFVLVEQKLAPVEVVFTLMHLYITYDRDLHERSQDILSMRKAVHDKYKGVVRANPTIYGFLWRQVDDATLKYEIREGNRLPDMPDPQPDEPPKPPKKRTPRRKPVNDSMDLDIDDGGDSFTDNGEGASSLAAAMNRAAESTPGKLKRSRPGVNSAHDQPATPKRKGAQEVSAAPLSGIKRKDRKRIKTESSSSSRGSPLV